MQRQLFRKSPSPKIVIARKAITGIIPESFFRTTVLLFYHLKRHLDSHYILVGLLLERLENAWTCGI